MEFFTYFEILWPGFSKLAVIFAWNWTNWSGAWKISYFKKTRQPCIRPFCLFFFPLSFWQKSLVNLLNPTLQITKYSKYRTLFFFLTLFSVCIPKKNEFRESLEFILRQKAIYTLLAESPLDRIIVDKPRTLNFYLKVCNIVEECSSVTIWKVFFGNAPW